MGYLALRWSARKVAKPAPLVLNICQPIDNEETRRALRRLADQICRMVQPEPPHRPRIH